ncbi:MAG: hypothetical protein IKY90_07200 [Oscillospiraceae bacterium]|nr:hypothetical protein [Oscillospiraceae bacterium]
MEKTMARAIYKLMEIGKPYTSMQLRDLLGDDYYKYIPVEMQGKDVRKIVNAEMWKVVNSGYARSYTEQENLAIVRGIRYGSKPTAFQSYTFRYWVRLK